MLRDEGFENAPLSACDSMEVLAVVGFNVFYIAHRHEKIIIRASELGHQQRMFF